MNEQHALYTKWNGFSVVLDNSNRKLILSMLRASWQHSFINRLTPENCVSNLLSVVSNSICKSISAVLGEICLRWAYKSPSMLITVRLLVLVKASICQAKRHCLANACPDLCGHVTIINIHLLYHWCWPNTRAPLISATRRLCVVSHDDVIKWKHFSRYGPFVQGIHWSTVNSPHKDQWRRNLRFSLICARINSWVNNGGGGDLRCHRAHYDVTVMPR